MKILFRGKRADNGEWVYGYYVKKRVPLLGGVEYHFIVTQDRDNCGCLLSYVSWYNILPETVGQYTGLTDKNGKRIFTNDIVQYLTYDDFDCQSIVKFGEYEQDGSDGEYCPRTCIGFYVEVDNFTCPDWCDDEPERFGCYRNQQNLLEVASECEVIGNVFDNIELLK